MKRWVFLFIFFMQAVWADPMITKVIELHYQSADKIVQLVQPILAPGEVISGNGQTLIVKVKPTTLTQIRTILHKLDQAPVTFQITVFQGDANWLSTQNDDTITISTNSNENQKRYQSVQVMNGESAFISTGQDQPVISNIGFGWWNTGVSYQRKTVQTGVLVEPLLQGQKVRLSVRRVREQDSQVDNQTFDQQKVMTTVMAPLNQWVSLGTAQGQAPADSDTEVIQAGYSFTQNATLYVKVTVVGKTSSGINK